MGFQVVTLERGASKLVGAEVYSHRLCHVVEDGRLCGAAAVAMVHVTAWWRSADLPICERHRVANEQQALHLHID